MLPFVESIWILIGGALWVLPISAEDFAYKGDGNWPNRDKRSVFPDLTVIIPRQGPLHSSGLEHWEDSSGVNKDGNIYSHSGEKCLQFD